MLPVRLDHNVPPFGFGEYQAADFSQWQGDTTSPAFQALAEAVRGHVDAARAQAERQSKQDQLAQQQAQFTRLQTELQQQQQVLQRSETQLAEQRELLELRSQAAQQKERDRQTEFARQTADLEKQRDELARQTRQSTANDLAPTLAAAERHATDLSAQLQTAREQARLAEQQAAESAQRLTDEIAANQSAQAQLAQQLADAQAQQAKLSAQIKALDDKQQELLRQAASDKQELTRQQQRVEQAEQAQRAAQEKQQTAEQARQVADKNRQTAEDKLRTAEKTQQAEQARLNQQLADQQRELTTLRASAPVASVVEPANPIPEPAAKPVRIEMVAIPNTHYEIGKYEVTQGEWKAVMGSPPPELYFKNCGETCPVESVSWNDIQVFLQKLNALTGKAYRLPTESEWQTACLAGKQTEYCGGNDANAVAWYSDNSGNKTHPVGQKQPNAYGLYDMSGNVWEWMQDKYDNEHDYRVLRGGSWFDDSRILRAAFRYFNVPSLRGNNIGFRLARTLP
jgi:formylglycine-generating enzyme required for sulfatase activity